MKRPWKIILALVFCLFAAAMAGRFVAFSAANHYGRNFALAIRFLGPSGFADTGKLRDFLGSPEMAKLQNRVRMLAFLGGGYSEEINELQQGMIYLSGQMTLTQEHRFSNPPQFKHLSMTLSDSSDAGVATAAVSLIVSYQSRL